VFHFFLNQEADNISQLFSIFIMICLLSVIFIWVYYNLTFSFLFRLIWKIIRHMLKAVDYPVELIKLAMGSHVRSAIANLGSILVFIFALKEFVPSIIISLWFIIHSITILLRFYFYYRIKIKLEQADKGSKQNYHNELNILIGLFFSSGMLWGIAIWLSVIYAPMAYIFLCIILLLGIAGGAIATLSPIQQLYSAFVLPMMFLQFFALLYAGESIYFFIAVLTILYTPVVYKASYSFYSYMLEAVQQRLDIERARQEADFANQAKSNFLANMSHEIRTPLNGIVALTQLLSRKVLDKEQATIVKKMNVSAKLLQKLIHDILDLAKIESGKFNLEYTNYQPRKLINECLLACESQASEKGVGIESAIKPSVPELLVGDPDSLSQIILNLVGNAVKFTESGTITLELDISEDRGEEVILFLSVSDTGIGISEDEQQKIFSNFTQSDNGSSRLYGGTGLGLSICRHLVDLMGGNISVESLLGEGSTFVCQIPMKKIRSVPPQIEQKNTSLDLHKMSILVVDDDEINRYAVKSLLETEGIRVVLAESGDKSLKIAEQEKFDLVLMDLHMPSLNGWDTTHLFRSSPLYQLSHVPIIGLTADVVKESHESCLEVGMNSVVSKPFKFTDLLQQIQMLVDTPK